MSWDENLEAGTPAHNFASSNADVIRTVAGPGSGKSFAIGRRIARLIEEGTEPGKILAITFTRTAAKDLRDDISDLNTEGSENVVACTVHSHALSILMQADVIGRTGRTPRMILDHEIKPALRDISDPSFGDIKNRKHLLKNYLAAWATLQTDEPGFVQNEAQEKFQEQLVGWMQSHDGMLVDEVIPVAINHLRYNPASPAIGRFDVILVDEYQDLNRAEQEFIRLIRGEARLVIVGDDDQSIYKFKFAHPDGIRTVDDLHGEYADIPFDQCRRCPTGVTNLAPNLIKKNPDRTLGDLEPFPDNDEGQIEIVQWDSVSDETEGLASIVASQLEDGGMDPGDVLILSPRRMIGYALRDALMQRDVSAKSYFRESSIKKDIAQRVYSQIIHAAFPDDKVSLRFLLGVGGSKYRFTQYKRICDAAAEGGLTTLGVLDGLMQKTLKVPYTKQILDAYREAKLSAEQIHEALKADPENIFENLFITDEETGEDLYELKEIFKKTLKEHDDLSEDDDFDVWLAGLIKEFQKEVANPEIPDEIDHVRVMSLHASKGLSAKFVIVCGQVDELIPGNDTSDPDLQEQRRLFYVAITRCKATPEFRGRLIISSFLALPVQAARQMGIPSKDGANRKVSATRYLADLGRSAPVPVRGETLIT